MQYRGFSFPVFTSIYLNIIWYPFLMGRLSILFFPSWISYSTISNSHRILTVLSKDCLGQTSCTGSEDFTFTTTKHYFLSTNHSGNIFAYIVLKYAKVQPKWALFQAVWEDYQRPALHILDSYDRHHSSNNIQRIGVRSQR